MVVRHHCCEVKGMKITIVFWSTGKLVNHETVDLLLLFCNFVVKANFMPNEQCH